jgi:hypothetical protein
MLIYLRLNYYLNIKLRNIKLKNYYDNWKNRVYVFYSNKNNNMLNFQSAKKLNADYVISRLPTKNHELKIICYK